MNLKKFKYIILGAGPSGLAFAQTLLDNNENSFIILEKENQCGGLCRSKIVDGWPLDIGGGHFLDTRLKNVTDFLFRFLPENEWNLFNRISTIQYGGLEIDYPFESNIWQFPVSLQLDFAESIAQAGCNQRTKEPELFEEWITWKLGDKIAEEYMLPYNRKIWGDNLKNLGIYWLYKLPDVSLRDTLQSIIERKQAGKIPAHAQFYYPEKYGYGEVWERIGNSLKDHLFLNTSVDSIAIESLTVNGKYQGKSIINTIPWKLWKNFDGMNNEITQLIDKLDFTGVQIDYDNSSPDSKAHWKYLPDESIPQHRILNRANFCKGSCGLWTETNLSRVKKKSLYSFVNNFAYPLNTIEKPKVIKEITEWASQKGIIGLGRWGVWEHMNSDIAVDQGRNLALNLLKKS